jgi:VIT1/CCC1 family predicted Fe2+/Mn2+ transporter
MQAEPEVSAIAHVVRLAVAPVFLLSGVAGLLGALTSRLARIMDRARTLESRLGAAGPREGADMRSELRVLSRRARLVNRAIGLSTIGALLICAVIVGLSIGAFLRVEVARLVAAVFVCAMLALVGALLSFLREIRLATRGLRIGSAEPARPAP